MNNRFVRLLVPLTIVALATAFILWSVLSRSSTTPTSIQGPASPQQETALVDDASQNGEALNLHADEAPQEPTDNLTSPPAAPGFLPAGIHFVVQPTQSLDSIGSIDSTEGSDSIRVDLSPINGGISGVTLRDYFETREKDPERRTRFFTDAPPDRATMGLHRLRFANGIEIGPYEESTRNPVQVWRQASPGTLIAEVVDGENRPFLTITRQYALGPTDGRIVLNQRFTNHTSHPVDVVTETWGPGDLPKEVVRQSLGDYRRVRFGYVDPRNPQVVLADRFYDTQGTIVSRAWSADKKLAEKGMGTDAALQMLWPNETSKEDALTLSWVAQTDRYFTFAMYPHVEDPASIVVRTLDSVEQVQFLLGAKSGETRLASIPDTRTGASRVPEYMTRYMSLKLTSPTLTVPPAGEIDVNFDAYAGPLHKGTILADAARAAFNMDKLPVYQMGGSCWCTTMCTFQSLAVGLLNFLRLIEGDLLKVAGVGIGVHDWGLAIIILVICVRALLHPLTKKGQISTMRFSKKMQSLQPDLAKLKEKYKHDPKKVQQEQIRLYREHNVNPAGCLGMLPTFLQMPIWIALYAMLFFAIELRQTPAFYGLFQLFGNWDFLADLSQPDHFISFGRTFEIPFISTFLFLGPVSGINLLPILMGVVFYLQQKYMMPAQANLTPEQETQQRIMKVMSVVLFPLMLYTSPSGLTLYIMTSTTIGIFESRYIRNHVTALELEEEAKKNGVKKAVGAKITKR